MATQYILILTVAIQYMLILTSTLETVSASVVTAQLQADLYVPIKAVQLAKHEQNSSRCEMTAICLASAPAA